MNCVRQLNFSDNGLLKRCTRINFFNIYISRVKILSTCMSNETEPTKSDEKETLTIYLSQALMRKIKIFCANNNMRIEQFAVDALLEKLSRWKE